MPYPLAKRLPIWIGGCGSFDDGSKVSLSTDHRENIFALVISGRVNAICAGTTSAVAAGSMIVLSRDTSVLLQAQNDVPFQYIILRFTHADVPPSIDLNTLCLNSSSVDAFFGRKSRFCVMPDLSYVHAIFNEILYEWKHDKLDRDIVLKQLITLLMLKTSRSFHAQHEVQAIRYISQARKYIMDHFQEALTVDMIAAHVGISRSYLSRLFRQYNDRNIVDFIQAVRCEHAALLLTSTRFPIIDIAIGSGFDNRQSFARTFRKQYGINPSEYRSCYRRE